MNSDLLIGLAACFYILVMSVFLGWVFWRAWGQWFKNRRSPVTLIPAVVSNKEQEAKYIAEYDMAEITRRFITFDCTDGIQREFEVPEKLFNSVAKGDHGTLHYRGTAFVKFDGARIASDLDDVYKRIARS